MVYATVLGYGSYLGPDYTAESLKIMVDAIHDQHAHAEYSKPYVELTQDQQTSIFDQVKREMKQNRYDKQSHTLTLTDGQAEGLAEIRA